MDLYLQRIVHSFDVRRFGSDSAIKNENGAGDLPGSMTSRKVTSRTGVSAIFCENWRPRNGTNCCANSRQTTSDDYRRDWPLDAADRWNESNQLSERRQRRPIVKQLAIADG